LGISDLVAQKFDIGKSVTAKIEQGDKQKARGMKEGIEKFGKKYPKYGRILLGFIEEKRTEREIHLKYDLNESYNLSDSEYVSVMRDLGLTEKEAAHLYPELMSVSERLRKRKKGLRSILIG